MAIYWDDNFRIGDAQVDHQHQQLFHIANQFLASTTQEAWLHCVERLFDYTRSHFAYEEQLMRTLNFPAVEQHVRAHQALVTRLEEVNAQVLRGNLDIQGLEAFIRHWALGHIPHEDGKLADYMENMVTLQGELR